ncbi:MAG TPA: GGDEF domain-containing protein [Burkholderiaceae bacterium]
MTTPTPTPGVATAAPGADRRQLIIGALALAMMVVAVAAALFQVQRTREIQGRYEDTLAIARLTLEADRIASRARALRGALPDVDLQSRQLVLAPLAADAAAWDERVAAVTVRSITADEHAQLLRLQRALHALASAAPAAVPEDDQLAAIDAAQAALQAAVRAAGEQPALRSESPDVLAARAAAIACGLGALALGAMLAVQTRRAQRANREAIGALGRLVFTDPLTGLTNRRGLDDGLPVELARAKRIGSPLTAVMLDLDFFKRYNARHGHAGGDALLRGAAQGWRKQLRPTDVLARYGGEEFTLVLPGCDVDQACSLIDRLRPLMPDRQTFSAGVAMWNRNESGAELLRRADDALLHAKRTGRNRTVVAGRETQIELPLAAS